MHTCICFHCGCGRSQRDGRPTPDQRTTMTSPTAPRNDGVANNALLPTQPSPQRKQAPLSYAKATARGLKTPPDQRRSKGKRLADDFVGAGASKPAHRERPTQSSTANASPDVSESVTTSLVTVLSSAHGRQRRTERRIEKRDLQAAVKHGTRE